MILQNRTVSDGSVKRFNSNSFRFLLLFVLSHSSRKTFELLLQLSLTSLRSAKRILSDAFACLPRKEVIQPHLPIRLPCYDFTPVIGFAFDAWLPCGLPQRLRAPPTPMV